MAAQLGRWEFWRTHVEAWRESGLTQRAYCREHELSEIQLSHWKHRLQKTRRRASAASRLVPVRVLRESVPRSTEVDGHSARVGHRGGELTLVLSNGWRLEIGEGINLETLSRVLEAVRHVG